MNLFDIKVIDGILSLRDAGLLVSYAFVLGLQIGHGPWRLADIKNFFRMVMRQ